MICTTLTISGSGTKAVEFGKFWADNLDDTALKTFARFGILSMGDELSSEPVVRETNFAYVLFTPSSVKYTELNILAGLAKIAAALFAWVKANPGKAVLLLGAIAYISIRIIDWQTKVAEKEIAISEDTTIKNILDDPTLTAEQKIAAILTYLQGKQGTDWVTVAVIGAAALLGYALISRSK